MMIHIAIPAMNEADYISQTLDCLSAQTLESEMNVYVCVNQPECYWEGDETRGICENNQRTLGLLRESKVKNIQVIDCCSKGCGWDAKKFGVGMARKVLMDYISERADAEDVVISLDADTQCGPLYVQSVIDRLAAFPEAVAVSAPYFHPLTGREAEDRAILRYEIYMRNYAIQMLLIDSPFAFTALGSAMAYRVSAYRAIGGMSPMKSGEDFYFLQQLRKYGPLLISNDQKVYPAARFSNRVFFGTGPAMIKGDGGDWSSYPIYHSSLFFEVKRLYDQIPLLYEEGFSSESAFYLFLQTQFKDHCFLAPLRKNAKNKGQFARAFHTKVDGLRVLQFLKSQQPGLGKDDRGVIWENYADMRGICNRYSEEIPLMGFATEDLAEIRLRLACREDELLNEKKVLL